MNRALTMLMVVAAVIATAGCRSNTPSTADASSTSPSAGSPEGERVDPAGQAYVDAVNASDLDALVAAFAENGVVVDVTRRISGHDAIRTWAESEVIGGRLEILAVSPIAGGQDLLVHWAPERSDGWRAHYRFTYVDARITVADLQYA
jgi:ketosteroid isomerase-like protein